MIIDLLGYPTEEELDIFNDIKDKQLLKNIERRQAQDFNVIFKGVSSLGIDLIKKMLTFDPNKRISVEEALKHPYLAALHCPEDEPTTEHVSAFDFDFEIYDLKKEEYKDLIFEEIMLYHSDEKLK